MNPMRNYTATKTIQKLDELLELLPLDDRYWNTKRTLNISRVRQCIQVFRDDLKQELYGDD